MCVNVVFNTWIEWQACAGVRDLYNAPVMQDLPCRQRSYALPHETMTAQRVIVVENNTYKIKQSQLLKLALLGLYK